MDYVLGAVIILVWVGILVSSINLLMNTISFDDGLFESNLLNIGLAIAGLIVCVASVLWLISNVEDKPCVKYDTTYQYNAATKTTMPVQYCAVEGEWVK